MKQGPDFIIVGAAKCGTTILHQWLKMQDRVFMPEVKEPHFFCFDGLDAGSVGKQVDPAYAQQMTFNSKDYARLFKRARQDQLCGEASPGYMYYPSAAQAIVDHNPQTKIICILRDPADRAYSQFMHHLRDGYENLPDLGTALIVEEGRVEQGYWWGYHYGKAGFYADSLRRYLDLFGRENILTLLFDDLVNEPELVFSLVLNFLGVSCSQTPLFSKRANAASGMPRVPRFPAQANLAHRNRRLGALFTRIGLDPAGRICGKAAPTLEEKTRVKLREMYRADILATASLIERDLSAWLE